MRSNRVIASVAILALGFGLSACESFSTSDWGDKIQDKVNDMNLFGSNKKPLPGDRKEVFPQGVPGVTQGVPPALMPGGQEANAQPEQPSPAPPPAVKKRKKVAAKKKPPPGASPPPDGVWPPPPNSNSPPPPENSVWPPPPK